MSSHLSWPDSRDAWPGGLGISLPLYDAREAGQDVGISLLPYMSTFTWELHKKTWLKLRSSRTLHARTISGTSSPLPFLYLVKPIDSTVGSLGGKVFPMNLSFYKTPFFFLSNFNLQSYNTINFLLELIFLWLQILFFKFNLRVALVGIYFKDYSSREAG